MDKPRIILPDAISYFNEKTKKKVLEPSKEAKEMYEHLQSITTGGIKFEDNLIYYVEVITEKWPSILEYGMRYKKLGYDIPNYCTNEDLKIITKEEFEEWDYQRALEGHYENFFKHDKKGNVVVHIDYLVGFLLERYKFKTIYGTKTETVYFYDDGIWNKTGKAKIKTAIEEILGEHSKNFVVGEIYEKIKRKTEIGWDKFNEIPEGLVCLENGIMDLKKGKFLPHSEKYYFKTKIPVFYDAEASCPNCMEFFGEALYPEDIELIQEWLGFNLYNKYFKKKAVILFGETDTGKTVLMILFTKFIGENNVVGLSLQKISQAKSFDLMNLKDKYANIHDDLGTRDLSDTGGFKIATGGGTITGEEKFGDLHGIRTFAKLTFATNKIPAVKDVDDDAYWSRWLPIPFDNKVEKEEQDEFLEQKLTTKDELSGLLNWAMIGLQRLIKNGRFTFNKSIEQIKDIMQRSSHPLSAFSQDCLEEEVGEKISKEELFETYSRWCQDSNVARMTKDQVGKQLLRFVPYILDKRVGKVRYWLNVKAIKFQSLPKDSQLNQVNLDPNQATLSGNQDKKIDDSLSEDSLNDSRDTFLKFKGEGKNEIGNNNDNIVNNNDNVKEDIYNNFKGVADVTEDDKIRLEFVNREDKNLTFDEFCKLRENIDILDKKDVEVINNE